MPLEIVCFFRHAPWYIEFAPLVAGATLAFFLGFQGMGLLLGAGMYGRLRRRRHALLGAVMILGSIGAYAATNGFGAALSDGKYSRPQECAVFGYDAQ